MGDIFSKIYFYCRYFFLNICFSIDILLQIICQNKMVSKIFCSKVLKKKKPKILFVIFKILHRKLRTHSLDIVKITYKFKYDYTLKINDSY